MTPNIHPARLMLQLLRGERSALLTLVVYAVFIGATTLAIPVAVQALVGSVAFGALLQPIFVLTVLLLAGLFMASLARALSTWVVESMQQRLFIRTALRFATRLQASRINSEGEFPRSELMNRFLEIVTVHKTVAVLLLDTLGVLLQTGFGLLALAFYHPWLLAFGAVFGVSLAFIVLGLGVRAIETSVAESTAKYSVLSWLQSVADQPLFSRGEAAGLAHRKAERAVRDWVGSRRAHFRILFRQTIGLLGLQAFASAGLLALGGLLVVQRQLTLGQLIAAELIVTAVAASIGKLGKSLDAYYDLTTSGLKLAAIEEGLPVASDGTAAADPAAAGASLSLHDVSLRAEDRCIIDSVSFAISSGSRFALLGPTGAGKTALLSVLDDTWSGAPPTGPILFNGIDRRSWRRAELHRRIAVVCERACFADTVEENIRCGRASIGSAEAQRALERVGLWPMIGAHPLGLQRSLGANGAPLSRGERVLLTLARALAHRPELILIDDFDALDPSTRDRVLELVLDRTLTSSILLATTDPAIARRFDQSFALGATPRSLA